MATEMHFLFGMLTLLLRLMINSSGVQSQSTTCQEGWTEHGNHCYWSQPGLLKSWEDAQEYCQSYESNLVKVETSEENSWLKTFATLSEWPWIGANDRYKEGEWRWISDNSTVTFTDWNPAQPDDGGGNEDCVNYWSMTLWNDHICTILHGFICEKEECRSWRLTTAVWLPTSRLINNYQKNLKRTSRGKKLQVQEELMSRMCPLYET